MTAENVKVVDVAISIFNVLLDVFIDTGAQNAGSGIRLSRKRGKRLRFIINNETLFILSINSLNINCETIK